MNPTILHRGARNGVTGSCHQLFVEGDNSLLVDCGLFQGTETAPDGKAGADRPSSTVTLASACFC